MNSVYTGSADLGDDSWCTLLPTTSLMTLLEETVTDGQMSWRCFPKRVATMPIAMVSDAQRLLHFACSNNN